MAWKAKLELIDDDGLHVRYYDDNGSAYYYEVYAPDQFNTKPELQAYAAQQVASQSGRRTKANNAVNKFNSLVGTDIA